jgi:iron(III) transport system ATP-binding protein
VVRSHGADIRLLVREDGGAHPEPGTETTVHVRPEHILQYHPETGNALRAQDPAAALP